MEFTVVAVAGSTRKKVKRWVAGGIPRWPLVTVIFLGVDVHHACQLHGMVANFT